MILKVKGDILPVLKFREEKRTFAKTEEGN
jgi:hypothetical protein